jgi:hypothetical protein
MAEEKLNPAVGQVSLDVDNFSTTTEQGGEYFDENEENWEKVRIPFPVIFLLFIPFWSLMALFYRHAEGWALKCIVSLQILHSSCAKTCLDCVQL